nr:neurofilament medium polypeptide [Nothobranchius furzeri]
MFLPNFERSSVQSGQEGVDDGPGEANSDSGDSLFITQKDVPEAVRSGRRRHTNLRSDSKLQQHEDLAELVPDSSSSSDEEPETARKGNKNCYKVPKFKFSFLNEDNKSKPIINNVKNAKFQTCAMASFIISVRELWRSFELGGDLAASLPTIDTDGEVLSSMSEGGEETSEGEDIKVVERKCFVTSLRKTRSQSWNSSDKRSSENEIQKKALKDSQKEEAKGTDRRSQNMLSKEFLSSATESSDDETVVSRKNEASAADIFAQIGRPTEESLITNSSRATACEPSPDKHIRRDQEVRIAPTEPNCEDFHTDGQSKSERAACGLENQNPSSIDIHNDTLCRKSRVKKRKKKKDREDEEHNQKATDDQHYLVDITKEEHLSQQVDTPVLKWKEKKKTKDATPEEEEVRHRQSEEEVEDDSVEDSKWTVSKKTKKKKEKSAEDVGQGQPEEQMEDDSVEKLTVSKKTKKRKEKFSKEDEVGQEQPEEQAEDNHVEEWTVSKKTKKKKEKSAEEEVGPGLHEEQVEDGSVDNSKWTISKKSKKKKEKSAEEEEEGQGQPEEQAEDRPVEKWTISKKTKKKEKSAEEDEFGQGQPEEEVKNDSVDDSKCTISKKTKKKNEKFSEEDEFGQGQPEEQVANNPVEKLTVFKKKKKKKDKFSKEDEVGQEQPEEQAVDNHVEEWTVSKKTKRRNFVEGNIAAETSGVGSTKKKKKKHLDPDVPQTSPGHHEETGKHLENTEVSLETTESRSTKRKKKKEPTSTDDPLIAGDDDDAVTMETGLNLTVTKISISATEDISHKADNSQKKKERAELNKKKMRGSSSAVICEETITPPGDSVLVQIKKKKTSSFLAADEEEKSRKKHKQQHGPSPSAAPPDVGTEALTATSADATEGYSESKDGGKRRRGLLLQSVWKEKQNLRNWRMHLKKKRRKRNNSEAMSSTEKVESLADVENSQTVEAVVKKRKKKKRKKDAEETRETG